MTSDDKQTALREKLDRVTLLWLQGELKDGDLPHAFAIHNLGFHGRELRTVIITAEKLTSASTDKGEV